MQKCSKLAKTVRPGTRTRKNPDPSFSGTGMAGYGYGSVIFTRGLPGIFTTDIAFTGQKRDQSLWKEALNSISKMRLKSRSYHLEKSISNPKRHLLKLLMRMLKRRTSLKKFHPPKVKVNGSGKNLVISGG